MCKKNLKSTNITMRMIPEDKKYLENQAYECDMSLTAYLTSCGHFSAPSMKLYRTKVFNELYNRITASTNISNTNKDIMRKELEKIYDEYNY